VHQLFRFELKQSGIISPRLVLAFVAYIVLAVLAWTTMDASSIPTRFGKIQPRLLTVVILGMFGFRTVLHRIREQGASDQEGGESETRE
jgi:hypothetical protein